RGSPCAAFRQFSRLFQSVVIPDDGGFGLRISQSSSANHACEMLPCVSRAKLWPSATQRDERRERLQRRIAPRQRNQYRPVSRELIHSRDNLRRCHQHPLVAIFGQHRIKRIAPSAAIVATGCAHEYGGASDERTFALYRRPKDLADAHKLRHGRNSARVLGVSATRTATTSGQRDLHQW